MCLLVVLVCCAALVAPADALAEFNASLAILRYSAEYDPSGKLRQAAASKLGVALTSYKKCIDGSKKALVPLLVYLGFGKDPYFVDPRYVHIKNKTVGSELQLSTELYPGWCVHVPRYRHAGAFAVRCYLVNDKNPFLMTASSQIRIYEGLNTTCGNLLPPVEEIRQAIESRQARQRRSGGVLYRPPVVTRFETVRFERDEVRKYGLKVKLVAKIIGAIMGAGALVGVCVRCCRKAKKRAASQQHTEAIPLPPRY